MESIWSTLPSNAPPHVMAAAQAADAAASAAAGIVVVVVVAVPVAVVAAVEVPELMLMLLSLLLLLLLQSAVGPVPSQRRGLAERELPPRPLLLRLHLLRMLADEPRRQDGAFHPGW